MAEVQNGLTRKVVHCWETASKHVSTAIQTCSHGNEYTQNNRRTVGSGVNAGT
jgi:hypothetical protein